jgi:hypothetical protein
MVLGNTSKFVEGFESFTADDEMMLANLKQAVNYTKAKMAISDVNNKLSSVGSSSTTFPTLPNMTESNNMEPNAPESRPMSFSSSTPSTTFPTRIINSSTEMSKLNTKTTTSEPMTTKPMTTKPMTTKYNTMKNNSSKFENIKKQDLEQDLENPARKDEEEGEEEEEQDLENPARKEEEDEEENFQEGFQGSQQIEGVTLKKMLLALLITFIGYMLIISATNNIIPIATYAPHLKQFKHFIYGSLFFVIVYLCLEVF